MGNAKMHGCSLLNSTTVAGVTTGGVNVSLAANADTVIYTVPTGYTCVLDHAVLVGGASAGSGTTISIGQSGATTDFVPNNTLDNIDAAGDAVTIKPIPNTTPLKGKAYAAGTVIKATVANNNGGATNTLCLFGFLY
jgi:hypothetical protein